MPKLSASEMERDFGFNQDDQAGWPGVGKFVGVNKYASLQTTQGDSLLKQTNPTVSVPAYIEKDSDGNIRVLHPATGPGEVWLAPPELEDYHLAGEHASHTGKFAGVKLPKTVSRVGLNIASFKRANSSHGDDVDGYLGWGLYHPTGAYVADGWVAKLTGSVGARNLEFLSTDEEGALDSGAGGQVVKINGTTISAGSGDITSPTNLIAGRVPVATGVKAIDDSDFTMTDDGNNILDPALGTTLTIQSDAAGELYTAGTIELGHVSDTTLSRSAAGVVAVEGVKLIRGDTGSVDEQVLVADSTGGSLLKATPVVIDSATGNTSGVGTLASGAHTNNTADGTVARILENDSTHGSREWHDEVSTTDATLTTVLEFAPPSTTAVIGIQVILIGADATGTDNENHRRYTLTYADVGGGFALQDSQQDYSFNPGAVPAPTFDYSGGNVRIRVTGIAAVTIRWHCRAILDYRTETA
jgi:hypothetical protein